MNSDLELLHVFRESCREHLDSMEAGVLDLEANVRDAGQVVDAIFRATHNLKGDAKVFGQERVESLCHAIENILTGIRNRQVAANKGAVNALLHHIDQIRNSLRRM